MTINTQKLRDLIRQACPLPWTLATSNSWRRIVDPYHVPVCSPCNQPDGHPDLCFPAGAEGPTAQLLIEAANSLPALLDHIDAQTTQIAEYKRILAGLPQDAIDGGWTAAGIRAYAKRQEAEIARLREALQFYADQDHFIISDDDAWDTVSGEPQNYFCDEAGTATVEDGSIARAALAQEQSCRL
ncbi:MAG: hypothetical protein WBA83_17065 [Burkholderiaceae bacterium]